MKACKIWPFPVSSTEQLELMPEDMAEQPCSVCTGAAGKERNSSVNRSDKGRLQQLCSHHFMRRSDWEEPPTFPTSSHFKCLLLVQCFTDFQILEPLPTSPFYSRKGTNQRQTHRCHTCRAIVHIFVLILFHSGYLCNLYFLCVVVRLKKRRSLSSGCAVWQLRTSLIC